MSQPFTRDEAKTAVWAQVEDFKGIEQITMLREVINDMQKEFNTNKEDEELIVKLVAAAKKHDVTLDGFVESLLETRAECIIDDGDTEVARFLVEEGGADWVYDTFGDYLREDDEEFADRMDGDADEAADRKEAYSDGSS